MNTCPYCGLPAKRVLCGDVECRRRYCIDKAMASKKRRPNRTCPCGEAFTATTRRRWCSTECKAAHEHRATKRSRHGGKGWTQRRAEAVIAKAARGTASTAVWISGTCNECGQVFTRRGAASPYCGRACSTKVKRRARRALTRTKVGAHAIHMRDAWTCHICGDPVNRTARVPDLDAPTLDHVIPLAAGGAHDATNLRTAHFYCNSVKRDLALEDVA